MNKPFTFITLVSVLAISAFANSDPSLNDNIAAHNNITISRQITRSENSVVVTYTIDSPQNLDSIEQLSDVYRNDLFTAPFGFSCNVELLDSEYKDINITTALMPNNAQYSTNPINGINNGTYRGQQIFMVNTRPIQINQIDSSLRVYSKISYKVSISQDSVLLKQHNYIQPYISPDDNFFDDFINVGENQSLILRANSTFANTTSINISPSRPNTSSEVTKNYLILTTTELLEAAQIFADWKHYMGLNTRILHKPKGEWNYDSVKKAVLDYYALQPKLYYLLIIGKNDDVPAKEENDNIGGYRYHYTDYYLGIMKDDDLVSTKTDFPDIYVGRLPVSTLKEAKTAVNKIIKYERDPISDSKFYNTALHVAAFEPDEKYPANDTEKTRDILTSEEIKEYLTVNNNMNILRTYAIMGNAIPQYYGGRPYGNHQKIPEELLNDKKAWSMPNLRIPGYINTGILYCTQMSHATINAWSSPYFKVSDISNLQNGDKLPLVFSMGCETGIFSHTTKSVAEAFITNSMGGAIAVFAPTDNSLAGYNAALLCGMIDAIWPNPGLIPAFPSFSSCEPLTPTPTPTFELGQVLLQGKKRMLQTFFDEYTSGSGSYSQKIFHLFGDPSMKFTTSAPQSFDARRIEIEYGPTTLGITMSISTVKVKIDGPPAKITFYNMKTKTVASFYDTKASFTSNAFKSQIVVCISDHNMIPYIRTWNGYDKGIIYIQNTVLNENNNAKYSAEQILIGNNVEPNDANTGNVSINGTKLILEGKRIELHNGIEIYPNSNVTLRHAK